MYKPENFTIQELVHPQILNDIGEVNAWLRLDADSLRELQYIRDEWYLICRSGLYCNRIGIGIDSRGLRPPNDTDGSFYSTHKQGDTFDLEAINGNNRALYTMIVGLIKAGKLKSFNTVEDFECTLAWVHVAKMNTAEKPLIIQP